MELKEGMYVRNKKGQITKITEINIKNNWYEIRYENEFGKCTATTFNLLNVSEKEIPKCENIIKSSYNIIDLIEEGDIVQWETIEPYRDGGINEVMSRFGEGLGIYQIEADRLLSLKDMTIKSIATHEQFDAMKYEVKVGKICYELTKEE